MPTREERQEPSSSRRRIPLRELCRLAGAAYTDRQSEGRWVRLHTYGSRSAAFHAVLWGLPDEPLGVFAVRGTVNWRSALQDLLLLLGREPRAWRGGRAALAHARTVVGGELLLTGHSLGGAFASALAVDAGSRAICFNAPGMRNVLPELAQRVAPWQVVHVGHEKDWIRLLTGPGLGEGAHPVARPRRGALRCGPLGIWDAFRRRRLRGEGWTRFVRRSVRDHRVAAVFRQVSAGLSSEPNSGISVFRGGAAAS